MPVEYKIAMTKRQTHTGQQSHKTWGRDWVAQILIKLKCPLKLNWHLKLLEMLHISFNWKLILSDVFGTQYIWSEMASIVCLMYDKTLKSNSILKMFP
jgi:hypothetical protein